MKKNEILVTLQCRILDGRVWYIGSDAQSKKACAIIAHFAIVRSCTIGSALSIALDGYCEGAQSGIVSTRGFGDFWGYLFFERHLSILGFCAPWSPFWTVFYFELSFLKYCPSYLVVFLAAGMLAAVHYLAGLLSPVLRTCAIAQRNCARSHSL